MLLTLFLSQLSDRAYLCRSLRPALALVLLLTAPIIAVAADYTVSTTGAAIVVTDSAGNGDTLTVSEPSAGNIKFAAAGRTFSVNGGGNLTGDSGNISLSGVNTITGNAGAGADTINVGAFTGSFPSLTINGGTDNDTVNFNGDITFAVGRSLDVDLQNDGGAAGVDAVNLTAGANLLAQGTGNITVRCSQKVTLASGASLDAAAGGSINVEANRQATPTAGDFIGVSINGAAVGLVNPSVFVSGRGGDAAGGSQIGVLVSGDGQIAGANVTVIGTGGAGGGQVNRGVTVIDSASRILGTTVAVNGQGGGVAASNLSYNIGVSVLGGAFISGESGGVELEGAGGSGGFFNQGIEVAGAGSAIYSAAGGNITLRGIAGAGTSVAVFLSDNATVSTPAAGGSITVFADSISLNAPAAISTDAAASDVLLAGLSGQNAGTPIDLGGADAAGTLGLTDAELDLIKTARLFIGNANSGAITISAAVSPALATNLELTSGSEVRPTVAGTDVTLNGSGILTLASPLACNVTGAAADTGYPQLKVVGGVNLNASPLKLTGTFAGAVGNTFTLVDNNAADAIIGTFDGLPQNAYLPWPGSATLAARISYAGGSGNDVVLTLVPVAEALVVTNTTDADAGSLRAVIAFAAGHPGADTITFDPSLAGGTIVFQSEIDIVDAAGVTINAPAGGIALDGASLTGHFYVTAGATLNLSRLRLINGESSFGGAIRNDGTLHLSDCEFTGNNATSDGGALYSEDTMTVTRCTLSGNTAAGDGGAILSYEAGTVTVENSTLNGNTASRYGGAIYNDGGLTLTNSTLTGNEASTGGGALSDNDGDEPFLIRNCTIAGNRSLTAGAGGGFDFGGTSSATLRHTILSGNTANGVLLNYGTKNSTPPALISNGYNLSDDAPSGFSASTNDQINKANINLDGLANNGGPTQTMALQSGSAAINTGDPAFGGTPSTDQRGAGFPRVVGGRIDIGAFESGAGAIAFSDPSYSVGEAGSFALITVNRSEGSDGAVSVRFRTADGTASAPADYTGVDQVLTFNAGETSKTVSIPINNDSDDELDETINLALSDATGGAFIGPTQSTAALSITDDDKVTPVLSAQSSPSVVVGGAIFDTATISGGSSPAGTITFQLFGPNDNTCGGAPIFTSPVVVNGNGNYISDSFTPTTPGAYNWVVTYSGDAEHNAGVSSACGAPNQSITATPTPCPPLIEGFDDITTLAGKGWEQINHSQTPDRGWFQGDAAFPAHEGGADSYIASDVHSTSGDIDANNISNWLLTPPLTLENGATMTFYTRTKSSPANNPDRLQVRMSTNGASGNVGSTATDVGDFTVLLLDINPTYTATDYPGEWTQYAVTVSGVPSPITGRLAFRYFVEDGGPKGFNSEYIGIDTFQFNRNCSPTQLANISTRLLLGTGDNALIGGFIVTGTEDKKVIIRAIGPSLTLAGKLENPTLELRNSAGTLLKENDDWMNSSPADKQAIIDSTIPPTNDLESAIVATLPANNSQYTAVVRGANNTTGTGVVEIYDIGRGVDSKLANISTRGLVQTGDTVLIAGTIVLGTSPQTVIIRAIGPSLTIATKLSDPTLELVNGNGTQLAFNDNWRTGGQEAEIIASTVPPTDDAEAAIVATLPANGASYTAIVRGVNNSTGIAVVEVYALN